MHMQPELINSLRRLFEEVNLYTIGLPEEDLLQKNSPEKWSAGENLEHLVRSTKPLSKALNLPKMVLKSFGKPNRPGRNYEQLVARYEEKLAKNQATAGAGYRPDPEKPTPKDALVASWERETQKLLASLARWKDEDLDKYLLPHPLLGKLTLREMMFFTYYHTQHHYAIMKERAEGKAME